MSDPDRDPDRVYRVAIRIALVALAVGVVVAGLVVLALT